MQKDQKHSGREGGAALCGSYISATTFNATAAVLDWIEGITELEANHETVFIEKGLLPFIPRSLPLGIKGKGIEFDAFRQCVFPS